MRISHDPRTYQTDGEVFNFADINFTKQDIYDKIGDINFLPFGPFSMQFHNLYLFIFTEKERKSFELQS